MVLSVLNRTFHLSAKSVLESAGTAIIYGTWNYSVSGLMTHLFYLWPAAMTPTMLPEWDLMIATFNAQKYEITNATDKEIVVINIYRDEQFNYWMDQARMVNAILKEAVMNTYITLCHSNMKLIKS